MKRGLTQERLLRQFCEEKKFKQHSSLQLFRRKKRGPWILYRRGTKASQPMGPVSQGNRRKRYLGWTFSKSLGTAKEIRLYQWVCLHHVAFGGVTERVCYAPKKKYKECAKQIRAKRIYIPAQAQRRNFNAVRGALIAALTTDPIFPGRRLRRRRPRKPRPGSG